MTNADFVSHHVVRNALEGNHMAATNVDYFVQVEAIDPAGVLSKDVTRPRPEVDAFLRDGQQGQAAPSNLDGAVRQLVGLPQCMH